MSAALVLLGDRLGLYKAMAGAGPLTPAQLAGGLARPSATSASGSSTRQPAAICATTRPRALTRCPRSRHWP
jgi:hypothetical protein